MASLVPLPATIDDGIRIIVEIIGSWYVQDIDGEDDDTLAKVAFKKAALDLLVDGLFQGDWMSEALSSISAELSE
jgi:hypothetical protein